MSTEAWVAVALGLGLPLVGSWLWMLWQIRRIAQTLYDAEEGLLAKMKTYAPQVEQIRKVKQTLYGDNGTPGLLVAVVELKEEVRKRAHWSDDCIRSLAAHTKFVSLPQRPDL